VTKFVLRRLVNWVVLVVLATSAAYILAGLTLNPRGNYESRNPRPPEHVVDANLDEVNLNDKTPILERYWRWAKGVVHGDFGRTWDHDSVNGELGRRIGVSTRLLLVASILGSILGVLAGAWGAVRQYRISDHVVSAGSFLILSVPVFVIAITLEIIAVKINQAAGHRVFVYTGEVTPGLQGDFWVHLWDRMKHLLLPSVSLILAEIAIFSRYQRSAMLDVLGADFVRTAQAKGLRRRTALLKHALRTALIPSATLFAYNIGLLFVGATFTEKIFGWHGMGEWLVDSITQSDVNAVAAVACFTAALVLLAGLLSDIFYALLDPRIRIN
jgi:peptide/nickel transport system permease protein